MSTSPRLLVRDLGRVDYETCYEAMRRFTAGRNDSTIDELWLVEHSPVYTLGQAGRREHLLQQGDIPLVQVDRGGQITYHGPGQVVAYTLLDLRRRELSVKNLVWQLEQATIDLLRDYGIAAQRRAGAPGVYVEEAKIAALGLRVRNGRCYHGLALNVDMSLAPFDHIDPCGYRGLRVTQLRDLGVRASFAEVAAALAAQITARLAAPVTLPASATV